MPAEHLSSLNIEHKRKPRTHHAPYKPRQPKSNNGDTNTALAPRTSARCTTQPTNRVNLTLHDWITVFKYVDEHPGTAQDAIVQHFKTLPNGRALIFDQSTLSWNLKGRQKLEARAHEYPNALSSKRVRVVTSPVVDRALFFWVKHMEEKNEHVTGPMLVAKQANFEEKFSVPADECLKGDGWLANFKCAYGIKEFRRHGEAGSVNLAAVEAERARLKIILANYAPRDRFNFDETGLFPLAQSERGLATHQMAGKKKDKFRITIGLACNADGSEKLPLLFIGKSAKPRCFKGRTPKSLKFDYHNNKNAWITMDIFETWLKSLDVTMRLQNRFICLLIDNFSGHYVDYRPQNIRLEFFEPNLTSHIQPCDAGIIRTTKALYQRAYCLRAVQRDDAGSHEIYKMDLLEAMRMVTDAWNEIVPATIAHCWNHTKIQPDSTGSPSAAGASTFNERIDASMALKDPRAWEIVRKFATMDMRLPEAEDQLTQALGARYKHDEWFPILKVVMDAESDTTKAIDGLDQITNNIFGCGIIQISQSTLAIQTSTAHLPITLPQLSIAENDLENLVGDLKQRRRIIGAALTLEEMLNPVEERDIGYSAYRFEGGDDEIVAKVNHEMAVRRGEIVEVESLDEDEGCGDSMPGMAVRLEEAIRITEQMEGICIAHGTQETSLDLARRLRQFRIELRKEEQGALKQATLGRWFGRSQ